MRRSDKGGKTGFSPTDALLSSLCHERASASDSDFNCGSLRGVWGGVAVGGAVRDVAAADCWLFVDCWLLSSLSLSSVWLLCCR